MCLSNPARNLNFFKSLLVYDSTVKSLKEICTWSATKGGHHVIEGRFVLSSQGSFRCNIFMLTICRNVKYSIVIVLSIISLSCTNSSTSKREDAEFQRVGSTKNGLEYGRWQYLDENKKVVEEGDFDGGIRIGVWRYSNPKPDSIFWNKYEGAFKTNVPDFFRAAEEGDSLIHFKYRDTSKIFDLIIGKSSSNPFSNLEDYQYQMYRELYKLNVEVRDTTTEIIHTTSGLEYLHTKIWGRLDGNRIIRIFSIVLFDSDSTLAEVTVRCDKEFADKAQIVFFSVISNLFYDSKQFMKNEDEISKSRL